jgi:hypothetical protein
MKTLYLKPDFLNVITMSYIKSCICSANFQTARLCQCPLQVFILADATASKSETVQANNLEDMRCMGMTTMNTSEWLKAF